MITRLARLIIRHRKGVLVGSLLVLIASFAIGGKVASKLNNGGFADPNAESTIGQDLLDSQFHAGSPNVVLLVTADHGTVDSPAVTAAGLALTKQLGGSSSIEGAASYWSAGSPPPLASRDHRQALILARITGNDDQVNKRIKTLEPVFQGARGPVHVQVTGQAAVFRQVGETIRSDLAKAEAIAVPITLVLLLFVFGSLVAASLPLAIGALAVGGTFATLTGLVSVTHVSIFSLNLTTALGLALAVDYSLFVVYRYREELRHGRAPDDAVVRTMETAGRAVLFSAAAVAVSLAALLVFPLYFLKSFAYAGIAVVVIAASGALIVLPALLATLGTRVDALSVRRRNHRDTEIGSGFWHRLAMGVMSKPVPIAAAIVALLLVLGAPFLRVHFGQPDDRVLPKSASTRAALDSIRTGFASNEANAISIIAPTLGTPGQHQAAVNAYASALSKVPGVSRVDAYTGTFVGGQEVFPGNELSHARFGNAHGTWLSAVPDTAIEPQSPAGEHLVHLVRAVPAPSKTYVAGSSAQLVDSKTSIFSKVPYALGIIALVTLVTLFLMFGSILVPVKAVILNLFSLTATFGAMVWVFQWGHAAHLLHFTPTGTLDTTTPILMFCVAFGLSMDYEVFLLSRIKEEHDSGADTRTSVAVGLEHTGRLITAASALLAIVFISFATSQITFIKLFGLGLTLAVLMDATLIRGTLVPAFMRLAGNANWWAPGPMKRFYERFGIHESAPVEPALVAPSVVVDVREPVAVDGHDGDDGHNGDMVKPRRERPLRAR